MTQTSLMELDTAAPSFRNMGEKKINLLQHTLFFFFPFLALFSMLSISCAISGREMSSLNV